MQRNIGQALFQKIMINLGYHGDKRGICFGFANMAAQAMHIDEINVFEDRLFQIREKIAPVIQEMDRELGLKWDEENLQRIQNANESEQMKLDKERLVFIRDAVKDHLSRILPQQDINNYLAFFDGVELYQNSYHLYGHLFPENVRSLNQRAMAFEAEKIILPEQLEVRGGVSIVDHTTSYYNESELNDYFVTLKNALAKDPPFHTAIAFIKCTDCF